MNTFNKKYEYLFQGLVWQSPLAVLQNKFSEHTAGYFPAPLQLDMFCNWVLASRMWVEAVCATLLPETAVHHLDSVVWDIIFWKWQSQHLMKSYKPAESKTFLWRPEIPFWTVNEWEVKFYCV